MMDIQQVKAKIAIEILSAYVSSFPECHTFDQLSVPTKLMVKEVVKLVMPEQKVKFLSVYDH